VHISCDGRALGRILATSMPEDLATQDRETLPPEPRAPARRASRVARVVRGLGAHLPTVPALIKAATTALRPTRAPVRTEPSRLALDNGLGGLTTDSDYEIRVFGDRVPPAPWANIIANRHGGFIVTERGGQCTWAENSQFFRLTPWHNDPVSDPVSEVIYLQDAESGELWCATPGPIRDEMPYTVRHGAGISSFEHDRDGVSTHLTVGMAEDAPVKLALLRVTNRDERVRRLTVTTYVEWALGVLREHTQHQVRTMVHRELGAILAQNSFDPQFAGWTAFHAISEPVTAFTASRRDFLGRNGAASAPAALGPNDTLSGISGAGIDPCAAQQCELESEPWVRREICILL
jgi:cyclic beta-1,2-glucan synthetase